MGKIVSLERFRDRKNAPQLHRDIKESALAGSSFFSGFDAPASMTKNIGRRIKFDIPTGQEKRFGSDALTSTYIIGSIQRIYDGRLAYRVYRTPSRGGADDFGRPARPDEIKFVKAKRR